MSDRRYVFDTNVLVSAALLENSVPGRALAKGRNSGTLLVSDETVNEVVAVLAHPKFEKYIDVDDRERFLKALMSEAEHVAITRQIQACRDPRDDKFLELATSGKASHIISGDEDLLVLSPFHEIPIVTPAAFLN